MAYSPVLVTGPTEPLLSIAEAKLHLHVDHDDEDGLIQDLVGAATVHLERILGIAIAEQTWRIYADEFEQEMDLPYAASSIVSVKAVDSAGATTTVVATNYALLTDDAGRSYVRFDDDYTLLTDLAETQGVAIEFVAGDAPLPIKQAARLMVGHFYANREAVAVGSMPPAELPMAVHALVSSYRRVEC